MSLQFENVLGRRAVATEGAAFVTLETTQGNFKMGSVLSEKLGVKDGDALAVQLAGGTYYIGKGKDGVAKKDANGEDLKDERNRVVYEEGQEPFGATIRNINESGAYQRFSANAAWAALGGNSDVKKIFELGEGVDATLETGNGSFSTTLYPLVFVKDEEKIVRGGAEKANKRGNTTGNPAQPQEDADFEAPTDEFAAPSDFNDEEL